MNTVNLYEDFVPKRLTGLRLLKKVSARDMSLSLGNDPSYIYSIESGKSLPSMRMFFAICDYLGIAPEEFFRSDIEDPRQLSELLEIYPLLDGEARGLMLEFARKLAKK